MTPESLARRFGTPSYLYDLAEVRAAHSALRDALPQSTGLYYSLKANPHPDIGRTLAQLGCRAEVSSVGEINAALAAGFVPDDIMLTGPAKSEQDIALAIAAGIRRFSIDSPADLARVGRLAARADRVVDVLIRLNADEPVPGMGLSMAGTPSPFGVDASWLLHEPEAFRDTGGAQVKGLHLYMGTNLEDERVLLAQFRTSIELAQKAQAALGMTLSEVDLGGGFGLPYAKAGVRPSFRTLREPLIELLDAGLPGWRRRQPEISFESGRYLTGTAGTLVCRVADVKLSKGRTYVILDAGINQLGGMSGLKRIPRIVPTLSPASNPTTAGIEDAAVAGPLCTPLDLWSLGVSLPSFQPGDVVTVPNVGAYGLTASLLGFLGHCPATEVVVDGDELVSATRLTLTRLPATPADCTKEP